VVSKEAHRQAYYHIADSLNATQSTNLDVIALIKFLEDTDQAQPIIASEQPIVD
jgi:hypothetical protein